ncbi:hypothetical protein H5V45_02735 [Nocardioides sp. KIGAM211]|uniref:Secreted protein n=1 Tax=Nocardioides luti TaxID=2761101 RepID=A0A7X0RDD8_9ACTN|nr:hypothetical protein [Nocardioides luti]MBB6626229.1 hypothetical protein [Nocardioides luti]
MARNILTSGATLLAATAATGALVLASPGLAQAATYSQGQANDEHSVTNGTGDADARSKATQGGKLRVFTEADGGTTAGPLGGTTSTPTEASAQASLSKRVPVAKGTYRVVVNYQGLQGRENDRGDNSQSRVVRQSVVKYVAQSGGGDRQVDRVQQVPTNKSSKSTTLLITVPDGSSGYLRVKAILKALSTADGKSSFAHGDASASNIVFKVNRI